MELENRLFVYLTGQAGDVPNESGVVVSVEYLKARIKELVDYMFVDEESMDGMDVLEALKDGRELPFLVEEKRRLREYIQAQQPDWCSALIDAILKAL